MEYIILAAAIIVAVWSILGRDKWTGVWTDGEVEYTFKQRRSFLVHIGDREHIVGGRYIKFRGEIGRNTGRTIIFETFTLTKTNKPVDIWSGRWSADTGEIMIKYNPPAHWWSWPTVNIGKKNYHVVFDTIRVNGRLWFNDKKELHTPHGVFRLEEVF